MVDGEKERREFGRWVLLLGLYNAMPLGAWEEVLLSILRAMYKDATRLESRRQLDYLEDRGLVKITKHPDGRWEAALTRAGVDIVEYTVDIDPGIARPLKTG